MIRKTRDFSTGQVFLIPLAKNAYGVGQVVDVVDDLGIACVFFDDLIGSAADCGNPQLLTPVGFAVTFTQEIKRGVWKTCPARPLPLRDSPWPHERYRSRGWVGLSILEGGLIVDYLAAQLGVFAPKPYQQRPDYAARFALRGSE